MNDMQKTLEQGVKEYHRVDKKIKRSKLVNIKDIKWRNRLKIDLTKYGIQV